MSGIGQLITHHSELITSDKRRTHRRANSGAADMNQDANNPRTGSPAQSPATAMSSTLKIAVPVFLLMAVIFGITFFAQYTPKPPEQTDGPGQESNEPPLRFFTSARGWDPPDLYSQLGLQFRGLPLMAPSADPSKSEDAFKFSLQDRI